MRPHVPNERLRPEDVPSPDAALADLLAFGHTFHAYRVAGSVDRVASLAADAADAYETDGALPGDLTTLRVVLFGVARAHHHLAADDDPVDDDPVGDEQTAAFVRALVARVRAVQTT